MSAYKRISWLLLFGIFCLSHPTAAQVRSCVPEPHTPPDDLRSTLDARLTRFLSAQAQGHWDDVEDLLGTSDIVHESSYRHCLILRMQELQMISFDLSTPYLYTCTTQIDLPGGALDRITAEQLPWFVRGTAMFQTRSETWTEETQIKAYRHQGQWYFLPPQHGMQEKWEKVHYTESDFARDRVDEVDIPNPASSPIKITDVHVHMNRQFPSLRSTQFILRNKTSKKVSGLQVKIKDADDEGAIDMQGPYEIEPNGYITMEEDVSASGDDCMGVRKYSIVIMEVLFADGSKWEFKEPAKINKKTE